MGFDAWITISILAIVFIILTTTRISPDLVFMAAITGLLTFNIVDAHDALIGLTNRGMITVAVLYIVAAGLKETGAMTFIGPKLIGKPKTILSAQSKIMSIVSIMSAFLNNTPVVAMFIPTIEDIAKKFRFSVSKLMIPLSFAAILGGMCTLIGTSTNLIINGMLIKFASENGLDELSRGLGMFDITLLALPCAAAGIAYILITGRYLLPDRVSFSKLVENPREFTTEMIVENNSPLAGKTIEQAGLRNLHGMYLMEIERQGRFFVAVSPKEILQENDRLVFTGIVESVVDLQKIKGLVPATNQVFKLDHPRPRRSLIEAVVSPSCPLIGKTVREGRFRSQYNAVIIAISRNGQRLNKKIGEVVLKPGDTLLLEARNSFVTQHSNSRDFYLVSQKSDTTTHNFEKAWIAFFILAGMVLAASFRIMSMLNAALLAAGLMILTRCVSWSSARKTIDWQVLITITAAFGMGRALYLTGAAESIASSLINLAGNNPRLTLVIIYLLTSGFNALVTNNAAAVIFFPISMAAASTLGVSYMPFIMTSMIAASASFLSPVSYQTNLMVYGPGGYRFSDYFKIGLPLNIILLIITSLLAPVIWPF